jgi:hypothetical protein
MSKVARFLAKDGSIIRIDPDALRRQFRAGS